MGWQTVAKCDVCMREKGPGNKWLLLDMYIPVANDAVIRNASFSLRHWVESQVSSSAFICGEECLQKRLREFLALRSRITAPATPVAEESPAYATEPAPGEGQ